jgi:hypothetical protein
MIFFIQRSDLRDRHDNVCLAQALAVGGGCC